MKLIDKINIRFGIAALAAMLLLDIGLSVALKFTFKEEVDEKLEDTYNYLKVIIERDSSLQSFPPYFEISLVENRTDTLIYSDTKMKNLNKNPVRYSGNFMPLLLSMEAPTKYQYANHN